MRTQAETPPLSVLARYRILGLRVPEPWVPWVERDLSTTGWLWRQRRWGLLVPSLFMAATFVMSDLLGGDVDVGDVAWLGGLATAWLGFLALSGRIERGRSAAWERAHMLAYQRREGPHPWRASHVDDGRGGPFWLWLVGALALAAVITVLVRALT